MSLFTHPAVVLFMKPGMKLMRELKFPAKMTLMTVVLLLPLSWLTAQALWSAQPAVGSGSGRTCQPLRGRRS